MTVKEFTHVRKKGRLIWCHAGFESFQQIRETLKAKGVNERVRIEYIVTKGKKREVHGLIFLNENQAIVGQVFPCGYCQNNNSLS